MSASAIIIPASCFLLGISVAIMARNIYFNVKNKDKIERTQNALEALEETMSFMVEYSGVPVIEISIEESNYDGYGPNHSITFYIDRDPKTCADMNIELADLLSRSDRSEFDDVYDITGLFLPSRDN